jgi:hypothetical protein
MERESRASRATPAGGAGGDSIRGWEGNLNPGDRCLLPCWKSVSPAPRSAAARRVRQGTECCWDVLVCTPDLRQVGQGQDPGFRGCAASAAQRKPPGCTLRKPGGAASSVEWPEGVECQGWEVFGDPARKLCGIECEPDGSRIPPTASRWPGTSCRSGIPKGSSA